MLEHHICLFFFFCLAEIQPAHNSVYVCHACPRANESRFAFLSLFLGGTGPLDQCTRRRTERNEPSGCRDETRGKAVWNQLGKKGLPGPRGREKRVEQGGNGTGSGGPLPNSPMSQADPGGPPPSNGGHCKRGTAHSGHLRLFPFHRGGCHKNPKK